MAKIQGGQYSARLRCAPLPGHLPAGGDGSTLSVMQAEERTISKRQLGIALAALGALAFLGILSIDILNPGRPGGIGPAQALALAAALCCALLGISLIPLGDAPA